MRKIINNCSPESTSSNETGGTFHFFKKKKPVALNNLEVRILVQLHLFSLKNE
jgi:hypothetical protein